jgi:acyl-CoA synthetase (AMP-forming)/AMP-acid ligase II
MLFGTHWSQFENVCVHGDWAAVDDAGLWYFLGRSDDTLKVVGKRVGPAEVESVLVNHPAVRLGRRLYSEPSQILCEGNGWVCWNNGN